MKFRIFLTVLIAVLTLGLAACEREGPMERAGEKLDDATEDVQDAVEDAGDEIEDATDG